MNVELLDEVMEKVGFTESQILEVLSVSLYQMNKINGVQGGKLLGISEIEFHEVVGKWGHTFSYDENDLLDDLDTLKKL